MTVKYKISNFNKGKAFVDKETTSDSSVSLEIYCINKQGHKEFKLPFNDIDYFEFDNEGFTTLKRNDKYALMNLKGEILTDFTYEHIFNGSEEGLFYVIRDKLHGNIDFNGHEVIPCIYETARHFREGVSARKLNGKWGMIDHFNNTVIPFDYDEIGYCCNNIIKAKRFGKWGLIDKYNNVLVDFQYDEIDNKATRYCMAYAAKKNNKYGFINGQGDIVEDFMYEDILFLTDQTDLEGEFLAVKKNNKYALYSTAKTKFLTDFIYDYIEYGEESTFLVKQDERYGFIDLYGNVTIPFVYDDVYFFEEGLACIQIGERYGFVDHCNNIVIPPLYFIPLSINDGMILVANDKLEEGYVDRKNNLVVPYGKYTKCNHFQDGFAMVYSEEKEQYIYIDTTGKELEIKL